jgi:predicted transposase YbfD/YdcC
MEKNSRIDLMFHLSQLEDPRSGENTRHKFVEILFISVCAIISGCECWTEFEDYGNAKKEWFKSFLQLKNGIPSHDTFRRVFCVLDFITFQKIFIQWTSEIRKTLKIKSDQICIDGKTLRGSLNEANAIKAIHMVNAWSTGTSMSLGQIPTEEKSNEITAIPELLELLNVSGCLVSIDAMGCQTAIVEKIRSKGGNFLLALKENQKGLFEATEELFRRSSTNWSSKPRMSEFTEKDSPFHGREELRTCRTIYLNKEIGFFPHETWPDVKVLIRIESQRIKLSTGEISTETRYYISDAEKKSAREFNQKIRDHWEVENKLHWSLDVAMNEDGDKKWAQESAKNFAVLRQMALNLLKKVDDKRGIKRRQKMADMDNNYLLKVLFASAAFKSYA